jgi:hypothetical protein
MRAKTKQRVACDGCGWSGGRAAGPDVLDRPCFRCGGPVVAAGGVYEEVRGWAGCVCGWYGEIDVQRIGRPCRMCGTPTVPANVVLTDSGQVLA